MSTYHLESDLKLDLKKNKGFKRNAASFYFTMNTGSSGGDGEWKVKEKKNQYLPAIKVAAKPTEKL